MYPCTDTWTESTATWNNSGDYNFATNWGATMAPNTYTAFDITTLVQCWKNGIFSAQSGFILTNPDESTQSNKKAPFSSEYSNTDYRPYVVMTYEEEITLDKYSLDLQAGQTGTIVADTFFGGKTLTWISSNTTVASVSSSGIVTANKEGAAVITVRYPRGDGTYASSACNVYVVIPEGVYYISNVRSTIREPEKLYLHVTDGEIAYGTSVIQSELIGSDDEIMKLRQMWLIDYRGEGVYFLRPYHYTGAVLQASSSGVTIGTVNENVPPSTCRWTIEKGSNGYYIKNKLTSANVLQIGSSTEVKADTMNSDSYANQWEISRLQNPPEGMILYDQSNNPVSTANAVGIMGLSGTLYTLDLKVAVYSQTYPCTLTYRSSISSVASVSSNGAIQYIKSGTTIITVGSDYGSKRILLYVVPFEGEDIYIGKNNVADFADNFEIFLRSDSTGNGVYASINPDAISSAMGWELEILTLGFYAIKNVNTGTYLTLTSSGSLGLHAYTGADNQKWKFALTESGAYQIFCRSTGECLVLNGSSVTLGTYTEDADYSDEWYVKERWILNIELYYDYSFKTHFEALDSTPEEVIDVLADCAKESFYRIFGVEVSVFGPTLYESTADKCKSSQGIAYSTVYSCDGTCGLCSDTAEESLCTNESRLFRQFRTDKPGNETTTTVLFTVHRLYGETPNRSFYSRYSCLIQNLEYLTYSSYTNQMRSCLMHELAHSIEARDHYHDKATEDENGKCQNSAICSSCGVTERPEECLMSGRCWDTEIESRSASEVFCTECADEVRSHLSGSH